MGDWSPDLHRDLPLPSELDLPQRLHRRFRRAVKALNEIRAEVAQQAPDAGWYLDGTGSLYLMTGPSHDGRGAHAQQQRIIWSETLHMADGGDW